MKIDEPSFSFLYFEMVGIYKFEREFIFILA